MLQTAAGLLLCALGYFLSHRESYEVRTVLATAGGCMMPTDIYEPRSGTPLGSVVLFHGLSANRKVMSFTAEEFANQDLRVFVPDLPGHGKTPGPFTPTRVESCAEALVRIWPFAGRSFPSAPSSRDIRWAARWPHALRRTLLSPASSPSPPRRCIPLRGSLPNCSCFPTPPVLAPHSLVLSAAWEPATARQIASDLVTQSADSSNKYEIIPRTTHVSILFAPATFEAMRSWCAEVLGTSSILPTAAQFAGTGLPAWHSGT